MKKSIIILSLLISAAFAIILSLSDLASAAPMPPETIVNDTTRECAIFFSGDECTSCTPPPGWRELGYGESCPDDYTSVDISGTCYPMEYGFCCTEGHSGAPGDCSNLVINDSSMLCAFVGNASNCTLSAGWEKKPENVSSYEWVCPFTYDWTTVNCTAIA